MELKDQKDKKIKWALRMQTRDLHIWNVKSPWIKISQNNRKQHKILSQERTFV